MKKKFLKKNNCNYCDKNFASKSTLKNHISSAHEGKKRFSCSFCEKDFFSKDSLNKHIVKAHEGKKPYNCELCESVFFNEIICQKTHHIGSQRMG